MPMEGSNILVDEVRLSMEARSIYKSIQTERTKLVQSSNLSRSDLHYFRARFNYYRLSLLRLDPEEKQTLEPILSQFLEKIVEREGEGERPAPPFLEAVEKTPPHQTKHAESAPVFEKPALIRESSLNDELQLVRLALSAEPSAKTNQLLIRKLDQIIESL